MHSWQTLVTKVNILINIITIYLIQLTDKLIDINSSIIASIFLKIDDLFREYKT